MLNTMRTEPALQFICNFFEWLNSSTDVKIVNRGREKRDKSFKRF